VSKLPVVPAAKIIKALGDAGFEHVRTKGSHAMLRHPGTGRGLTVPMHDPVKRGTLRAIIRQAGLEVDEFLALLHPR
jgi:predicted RNA binding protein YcfA (HicA-like mRNA interferase family)